MLACNLQDIKPNAGGMKESEKVEEIPGLLIEQRVGQFDRCVRAIAIFVQL
jgi:hypothetical protein